MAADGRSLDAVVSVGGRSVDTLGAGSFGTVASFVYNGTPVAVKELKAGALDDSSIGRWGGTGGRRRRH